MSRLIGGHHGGWFRTGVSRQTSSNRNSGAIRLRSSGSLVTTVCLVRLAQTTTCASTISDVPLPRGQESGDGRVRRVQRDQLRAGLANQQRKTGLSRRISNCLRERRRRHRHTQPTLHRAGRKHPNSAVVPVHSDQAAGIQRDAVIFWVAIPNCKLPAVGSAGRPSHASRAVMIFRSEVRPGSRD
jgi:hypothetical protein